MMRLQLKLTVFFWLTIFVSESFANQYQNTKIFDDLGVYSVTRPGTGAGGWQTDDKVHTWFLGETSNAYASSYDKNSETWSTPVKLGNAPVTTGNDHYYPIGVELDDGRLMVFYGSHNSMQRYSISTLADDTSSWDMDREIHSLQASSYPYPFKSIAENDIFVFSRETRSPQDYRPVVLVTTKDNGETWSESESVIDTENRRSDHLNEVYIQALNYEGSNEDGEVIDKAHIVFTLAGGGVEEHKHNVYRKNIYYAYFQTATRSFYNVKGELLGPKITYENMNKTLVLDTGAYLEWKPSMRGNVVMTNDGSVAVSYQIANIKDTNKTYAGVSAWDGEKWVETDLGRRFNHRHMYKEEYTPSNIYLWTSNVIDDPITSDLFKSTDGGLTWNLEEVVPLTEGSESVAYAVGIAGKTYSTSKFIMAMMERKEFNGDYREEVVPHRDILMVGRIDEEFTPEFATPSRTPKARPATPTPPTPKNSLGNGDFSAGDKNWELYVNSDANAQFSVLNNMGYVKINNPGDAEFDIQLRQFNLTLENGREYRVRYSAKSKSGDRSIQANFIKQLPPYSSLSPTWTSDLTETMQDFEHTFIADEETNYNARFRFRLGKHAGDVLIDNVQVTDITDGEPTDPPGPTPVIDGVVASDDFSSGSQSGGSGWASNWRASERTMFSRDSLVIWKRGRASRKVNLENTENAKLTIKYNVIGNVNGPMAARLTLNDGIPDSMLLPTGSRRGFSFMNEARSFTVDLSNYAKIPDFNIALSTQSSRGTIGILLVESIEISSSPNPSAPAPQQIAAWSMDKDLVDSLSGVKLTPSGSEPFSFAEGYIKTGLNLSGGGYVKTTDEAFNFDRAFTVSLWAKPESDLTQGKDNVLIDRSNSNTGYRVYLEKTTASKVNKVVFRAFHGAGHTETATIKPLAINEWSKIDVVYTGQYTKIFVNGRPASTDDAASIALNNKSKPDSFNIGGLSGSVSENNFAGFVDEVDVFNYALSEDAIFSRHFAQLPDVDEPPAPPSDLAAGWSLDGNTQDVISGSSLTVKDISGGAGLSYASGVVGDAAVFSDRKSYLARFNDTNYDLDTFTISMWVKAADAVAGGFDNILLDRSNADLGYRLYLEKTTASDINKVRFKAGGVDIKSSAPINVDEWVHVAVTVANGTANLYLNGNLDTSGAVSVQANPTDHLLIGGITTTESKLFLNFMGELDEVRLYDKALSEEKIIEYVTSTAP